MTKTIAAMLLLTLVQPALAGGGGQSATHSPLVTGISTLFLFVAVVLSGLSIMIYKKMVAAGINHHKAHKFETEVIIASAAMFFMPVFALCDYSDFVNYLKNTAINNSAEPVFVFWISLMMGVTVIGNAIAFGAIKVSNLFGKWCIYVYIFMMIVFIPFLGSFITEPGAMVVCVGLLGSLFAGYNKAKHKVPKEMSSELKMFAMLIMGTILVHVSIGGTLTNFSAPAVLMVAKTWDITTPWMIKELGIPNIIATLITTGIIFWKYKHVINEIVMPKATDFEFKPIRIIDNVLFVLGLVLVFIFTHSPMWMMVVGLIYVLWSFITHQEDELEVGGPFKVAGFLAGLIFLGHLQEWWITPIMGNMENQYLLGGTAAAFTMVTDNALITTLCGLLPNLSPESKELILKGALVTGGMTIIANAPNPLGLGKFKEFFFEMSFKDVAKAGLLPTGVALVCNLLF